MYGKCNACGWCCIVLMNRYDKKKLIELHKQTKGKDNDLKFITENWSEIPRDKAMKINPHLEYVDDGIHFYLCSKFNKDTKKCIDYNNRPGICKRYPWGYIGINLKCKFYTNDCGFKVDQEVFKLIIGLIQAMSKKKNSKIIKRNLTDYFYEILIKIANDNDINKDDVIKAKKFIINDIIKLYDKFKKMIVKDFNQKFIKDHIESKNEK